jgi:hypothetical protein
MKKCSKCGIEKELTEFNKRSDTKNGYRGECKMCIKEKNKIYNEKNKEALSIKKEKYIKENKEIVKETKRKYYENNKEELKEKARVRYNNLKDDDTFMERIRTLSKKNWTKYRENNRDRINKKIRDRKHNDPLYKLTFSIRTTIHNSITRMGYSKRDKSREILGCSFEDFMKYIEEQFLEGMSWDNHGEWHLDHKIPVSWANTEEEIYELNRYTNFQPLWSFDNLSKGNRYSH